MLKKIIECIFLVLEMRQRGRFAWFSLYISNSGDIDTSALCYHDQTGLPSLNFTAICLSFGRYVIFYNERLNGVSYPEKYEVFNVFTELCEVIVYGKYYKIYMHNLFHSLINMCNQFFAQKMSHEQRDVNPYIWSAMLLPRGAICLSR